MQYKLKQILPYSVTGLRWPWVHNVRPFCFRRVDYRDLIYILVTRRVARVEAYFIKKIKYFAWKTSTWFTKINIVEIKELGKFYFVQICQSLTLEKRWMNFVRQIRLFYETKIQMRVRRLFLKLFEIIVFRVLWEP